MPLRFNSLGSRVPPVVRPGIISIQYIFLRSSSDCPHTGRQHTHFMPVIVEQLRRTRGGAQFHLMRCEVKAGAQDLAIYSAYLRSLRVSPSSPMRFSANCRVFPSLAICDGQAALLRPSVLDTTRAPRRALQTRRSQSHFSFSWPPDAT